MFDFDIEGSNQVHFRAFNNTLRDLVDNEQTRIIVDIIMDIYQARISNRLAFYVSLSTYWRIVFWFHSPSY